MGTSTWAAIRPLLMYVRSFGAVIDETAFENILQQYFMDGDNSSSGPEKAD